MLLHKVIALTPVILSKPEFRLAGMKASRKIPAMLGPSMPIQGVFTLL
jgi:hypothetical protein